MFDNPSPMISVEHDAKTDFTYDGSDRVTGFKCRSGGATGRVVGTMAITYDGSGRIASVVFTKA